jgi:Leucine-rich repeat (LRR) protein
MLSSIVVLFISTKFYFYILVTSFFLPSFKPTMLQYWENSLAPTEKGFICCNTRIHCSCQSLGFPHGSLTLLVVNSSDILDLSYLERLNLVNCNIREIPRFLRNLGGLVELDLSNNKIHGQVPKWIWQLQSLVHLNLSNNSLNGIEVPVSSQPLDSLIFLDLTSNLLEGSIPVLPSSIKFLSLAINKLTGEIPVSFCNVSSLTILGLCYNYMTGEIPQCLMVELHISILFLVASNLSLAKSQVY